MAGLEQLAEAARQGYKIPPKAPTPKVPSPLTDFTAPSTLPPPKTPSGNQGEIDAIAGLNKEDEPDFGISGPDDDERTTAEIQADMERALRALSSETANDQQRLLIESWIGGVEMDAPVAVYEYQYYEGVGTLPTIGTITRDDAYYMFLQWDAATRDQAKSVLFAGDFYPDSYDAEDFEAGLGSMDDVDFAAWRDFVDEASKATLSGEMIPISDRLRTIAQNGPSGDDDGGGGGGSGRSGGGGGGGGGVAPSWKIADPASVMQVGQAFAQRFMGRRLTKQEAMEHVSDWQDWDRAEFTQQFNMAMSGAGGELVDIDQGARFEQLMREQYANEIDAAGMATQFTNFRGIIQQMGMG